MYCQACRAKNADDEEYCRRCHQKLMILSGPLASEEGMEDLEEDFSFDEHLLERISILEEALKRTTETVQQLLDVVSKQQESLALTEAGVATARELLERHEVVEEEAWEATWRRHRSLRLLAIEKRDHFQHYRTRIRSLHRGGEPERFEDLLDLAEQSFAAMDLERAIDALELAFDLDPANHEMAHFLGETLFNAGRSAEGLTYFEQLLALEPDHYEGLVYAGVIQHEEGDREIADRHLRRAEELYPDAFLPHFSLGAVCAARGDAREAAQHLRRAVAIDAAPQALFLLGRSYQELGEVGRAIRELEAAVEKSPDLEEGFYQLGLAYLDRRWNRKALEAFRQAHELNPQKFHYRELVRYLADSGDSPLPKVPETIAGALARGEEALSRDEPEEAYRQFRDALRTAPDHPTLLTYYALTCLALDRTQEIEDTVKKIAAAEPGEMLLATAYAIWIEALRSAGRFAEGHRVGHQLLDIVDGNVSRTIAYYEMAWSLAEMDGDLDEALGLARRALELSPEELRQFPLAALGWVHYKRHEFPQAVDYLDRANRLGTSSSTLTQLGMALLASGEEEEARSVLDRARTLRAHGSGVEFKMMECLRDSRRMYDRLTEQSDRRA
jgi:tetratricopeptide (TPR) repeat protein